MRVGDLVASHRGEVGVIVDFEVSYTDDTYNSYEEVVIEESGVRDWIRRTVLSQDSEADLESEYRCGPYFLFPCEDDEELLQEWKKHLTLVVVVWNNPVFSEVRLGTWNWSSSTATIRSWEVIENLKLI